MSLLPESWASPPADVFQRLQNSVHVWRLQVLEKPGLDWEAFLSDEEKARAGRYHFPADQRRFGRTRGLLRFLLGRYLNRNPLELSLVTEENGRPVLKPADSISMAFSVSHSGGAGLIALTRPGPVGVDVEKIREDFPDQKIANRFFSEGEKKYLLSLSQGERQEAFFRLWTLKEAFFKARGEGLLLPLNRFRVLQENPPRVLDEEGAEDLSSWRLEPLPEPAPGHRSSLAFQGGNLRVDCWDAAPLQEIQPSLR